MLLTYNRWSVLTAFSENCKDLQFLTLINFLDNYLPLVLRNYGVIFRSKNIALYISALTSPLLQVTFCIPLEFSQLGKMGHPLHATSLLAFTEYPVHYFHSLIRNHTSPHSTPEQITKTCQSIFASKQRQDNFSKRFCLQRTLLSQNQLK